MTRTLLLGAAAVAALSLAACNKPASTTADNAATATSNAALDTTSAAGAALNKAEDATGAAVGAAAAAVDPHDTAAFVSNASQSDMYEIQAAQIAEKRSKNKDIVAFAKMMVKDHTASSKAMAPLVQAANQSPADKLDNRRQGFLDHLNQASDADFDKTYADQQVAAHEEALNLMQGYAKDGSDAGLKGGAAKIAPTVQAHLDKIKSIQASLKS